MQRKMMTGAVAVALACACVLPALAERRMVSGKAPARTDDISTTTTIDANQMDMFVTNIGVFAYDKSNARGKADGLYYPNNYPLSDKTVIYDAGLWFGGVRGGDTLVTVAEYSQEYSPGQLGSDPAAASNRVYKIYKNHLQKVADGYLVRNPNDHEDMIPLAADDYTEWPRTQGAPMGSDGTPWINELGADQMTFTVFNDGVASSHTNDAGSTAPIGLEVKQTTFAFNRSDALGNVIFMKYEITYDPAAAGQPELPLEDAYLSLWSDPDLGGSGDDFVGCNPSIGLGYCYNATNQDKAYGSQPPAVGFDFFKGPRNSYRLQWPPNSGNIPEFLPMTSFNKYINGTDPHSMQQSYAYMQGLNSDGTPLANGTTYQMAGDPVGNTGEIDTDPADRRFMMSAGPFSMQPGETVEVVAAVLVAQGGNRLSSITYLNYIDQLAQEVFDADFVVKQPPAQPEILTSANLNREVSFAWSDNSITDHGDYDFQGYNLWQGETAAGPWTRVATYDLVDEVETIYTWQFNVDNGELYLQPAQFGLNSGIQFSAQITQDIFTWGGNPGLVNNHPYYFALSAYSYSDNPADSLQNFLESAKSVIMASPTGGPAGVEWGSVGATVTHTAGQGNGPIEVNVIDDWAITGNSYAITFHDTTYVTGQEWQYNEDGTDSTLVDITQTDLLHYILTNSNSGEVLIPAGTNLDGDVNASYPYTEGMVISVKNLPEVVPASYSWVGEGGAARWLTGVDAGGPLLGGGLMFGFDFRGSSLTLADMKTVEVRLTPDESEWSDCATYTRPGYAYAGIGRFPGSIWDVTVDPPRRLNACFVENTNSGDTADLLWNPNNAGLGGRHYLFINNSNYNGGVDYNTDTNRGIETDVLWAWWPILRDESTPFADQLATGAGTFTFVAAQPYTHNDVVTIQTTALDVVQSESALNVVRAVPNPYYGHSAYETKSDVKVVKFTSLPDVATIKLFNIAGDHVRTLHKSANTTHEVSWDLKNEYGVYVASGVYVYYVEAPGYGDSFGKLAVMLEEERLKEY